MSQSLLHESRRALRPGALGLRELFQSHLTRALLTSAAYYAGGALPGADVTWSVSARTGSFRPPNRDDFVFGRFVPWWRPLAPRRESEQRQAFAARTDGSGRHRLRIVGRH